MYINLITLINTLFLDIQVPKIANHQNSYSKCLIRISKRKQTKKLIKLALMQIRFYHCMWKPAGKVRVTEVQL